MNYYCTLFDSHYLTRGLSLYESLLRHEDHFRLYVLCFDNETLEILNHLDLPGIQTISQSEFETPELLKIKPSRTKGEYCWTSTPHLLKFCIDKYQLDQITYLDADIYFFQPASILLQELKKSGGSTLLTEHHYAPRYKKAEISGKYCVQFMTFKSDAEGMSALQWWADRCLEWCYNRHEDGKFGDQKYLDDWTTRFTKVHVLNHLGGGVAPWNLEQYKLTDGPRVDDVPIVFYHYHHLLWFKNGEIDLAYHFKLSEQAVELIYKPYIQQLKHSLQKVRSIKSEFSGGLLKPENDLKSKISKFKRKINGRYFVIKNS